MAAAALLSPAKQDRAMVTC